MRIMTIYTKEIYPFALLEIADPFTVDADFPVTIDISVTLTAEQI